MKSDFSKLFTIVKNSVIEELKTSKSEPSKVDEAIKNLSKLKKLYDTLAKDAKDSFLSKIDIEREYHQVSHKINNPLISELSKLLDDLESSKETISKLERKVDELEDMVYELKSKTVGLNDKEYYEEYH